MFTTHFDYLYVEPSTFCAVKCPRCPRTYSPNSFKLSHLNLQEFENFISSPLWENIKTIEFGGNYGDPIFHPRLSELVNISREQHPEVEQIIHTSGNQRPNWWEQFLPNINKQDKVLFSIDGLEDTNHLYRVGSNWAWIEKAVLLASQKATTFWKFIVFRHNQHQIIDAIKKAKDLGVSQFILTKSGLFNGDWNDERQIDPMAPDSKWIARGNSIKKVFQPKCQTSSRHYLSADGQYSPCCWIEFSRNYSQSISERQSLSHIMSSVELANLKADWLQNRPKTCESKCQSPIDGRSSHQQLWVDLSMGVEQLVKSIENFADGNQ